MLEKLQEKQIYETSSYCLKVGKLYRKQKTTQRDTQETQDPTTDKAIFISTQLDQQLTSNIQQQRSKNLAPTTHFETFAIPPGTSFAKSRKLVETPIHDLQIPVTTLTHFSPVSHFYTP